MAEVVAFISEVPTYDIQNGNMLIRTADWAIAMPLPVFRQGMAKAAEVIAKWQLDQLNKNADIVPMRP